MRVYKNGQVYQPNDHTTVRQILSTGLVKRVSNFGPLLEGKEIKPADKIIVVEPGFELHIIHEDESHEFGIGVGFVTIKDTNLVYYQRLK